MKEKKSIKILELDDKFTNYTREYPYVHDYEANLSFRLRSRKLFDNPAVLLIQKLKAFDYLLPLTAPIDISKCEDDFTILEGTINQEGAWIVSLPPMPPGVVSFQLVFKDSKTTSIASTFGTADLIILTQNTIELRRLRKMTVFPRCIGRAENWNQFFSSQIDLGYNAFHLAPIQETGASKSYYSLKSHLQLSSDIFTGPSEAKVEQLKEIMKAARQKGAVFFIDIILNHVSFDSDWIREDLRSVFTVENTPMLYTAFLVDQAIFAWGQEIKKVMENNEPQKMTEQYLKEVQKLLQVRILALQIERYFLLAPQIGAEMIKAVEPREPSSNIFAKDPIESIEEFLAVEVTLPSDLKCSRRLRDMARWVEVNLAYTPEDMRIAIQQFNSKWAQTILTVWMPEIISNTMRELRSNYVEHGYRQFNDKYPLVGRYFSKIAGTNICALNNGWVSQISSTSISSETFVESTHYYFLRRRVNIWGDLLRIRYNASPKQSPTAWAYMLKYIQHMASLFDGFRLDNLHGTQLSVAKFLIKEARKINPNIVVFAQLFTDTEQQTALFVRSIGINSVLKQAQYLLSGKSFVSAFHRRVHTRRPYLGCLSRYFHENGQMVKYCQRKLPIPLVYDLTHDNRTYMELSKHVLMTPVSVLISFMGTFIGSTKGYDQFYTHKIDVTELQQLYQKDVKTTPQIDESGISSVLLVSDEPCSIYGSWNGWQTRHVFTVDEASAKYKLLLQLPAGKYEYKFKREEEWYLNPKKYANSRGNHQIVLQDRPLRIINSNLEYLRKTVAKLAVKYQDYKSYLIFHMEEIVVMIREPNNGESSICVIANLSCSSQVLPKNIELLGSITGAYVWMQSSFKQEDGLVTISQVLFTTNIREYFDIYHDQESHSDSLAGLSIPPGFACLIELKKCSEHINAIRSIKEFLDRPLYLPPLGSLDVNLILFGCENEEKQRFARDNYFIPQSNQKLIYAGFGGVYQIVRRAKQNNLLDIGLFENLRCGNWLFDYYLARLKTQAHLLPIVEMLEQVFANLKQLPKYLVPRQFTNFILKFVEAVELEISNNIAHSSFERRLILASGQFITNFPNKDPRFQTTLSAGLPHFAVNWARCWGRDTFTCSEILSLHPSIFKQTIVQFASALRHGLIPNLLDDGRNPRYNSRDASWWFIRAISEYIAATKDYEVLKCKVEMLFLSSDAMEHSRLKQQGIKRTLLLEEVVQEIFQSHADGIHYREWRAGYQIDSHMSSDGFNISLEADPTTGFILGGNSSNCLTWMDKMGSSAFASNKGVPATPRAGAPIELVGLLYHCLNAFSELNYKHHYSYSGVKLKDRFVLFSEWSHTIELHFEPSFYLKQELEDDHYISGIYQDVAFSHIAYEANRFRPNALIAMVLAPQLFDKQHALSYLHKVGKLLIHSKSIGISTLHDSHKAYSSSYDNSNNTNNFNIAQGFSYHNGPEWVWLFGYYLVAKIAFDDVKKSDMLILLQEHIKKIEEDEWMSLPEITNRNGEWNPFGCSAQAWSVSSMLMAVRAINRM